MISHWTSERFLRAGDEELKKTLTGNTAQLFTSSTYSKGIVAFKTTPRICGLKKRRRITKVMIKTERTIIFRNLGGPQVSWCEGCGAEAPLMNVTDAAREAGVSELAIYQLLDDGALHFTEDTEGRVLICLNSLFK